jgi:hypothetical protein
MRSERCDAMRSERVHVSNDQWGTSDANRCDAMRSERVKILGAQVREHCEVSNSEASNALRHACKPRSRDEVWSAPPAGRVDLHIFRRDCEHGTTTERVSVPAARVRLLCEESAATARTAPPVRQVTPPPRLVRRNHFSARTQMGVKATASGLRDADA